MNRLIYVFVILSSFIEIGCDNANELLNQYIKDGPIVYAGKINDLDIKAGYHRVGIYIYPAEDVNKAYCILRWNTVSGTKDSVKIDYSSAIYDSNKGGYYKVIDMPNVEGNVSIDAFNIDLFGNKSLLYTEGGFVYGENYLKALQPATVKFITGNTVIEFDSKIGVIGNLISYEQNDGLFTSEIYVVGRLILINPKKGGKIKSKSKYLINLTDIDTLITPNYRETIIP